MVLIWTGWTTGIDFSKWIVFKMDCCDKGGGDLNFTLGASKVWGIVTQLDPLSRYFIRKLEETCLLDIEPSKLSPTWSNKRVGEARIAKRLDMFLILKPS
jgi:hypothetical protein